MLAQFESMQMTSFPFPSKMFERSKEFEGLENVNTISTQITSIQSRTHYAHKQANTVIMISHESFIEFEDQWMYNKTTLSRSNAHSECIAEARAHAVQ